MEIVLEEFKDRIQEINIYINFINNIDSTPMINDKLLNTLKANCLLMIYNLVESAFTNGIEKLYTVLKNESCKYQDVNNELQNIWFDYQFRKAFDPNARFNTYRNKAFEIITSILNQDIINLNKKATNINGNLDDQKIRKICDSHGIRLSISTSAYGGNSLTDIKQKRNNLAHGTVSFSECGRDYSINDLKKIKTEIIIFLFDFIKSLKYYLKNKEYLKLTS